MNRTEPKRRRDDRPQRLRLTVRRWVLSASAVAFLASPSIAQPSFPVPSLSQEQAASSSSSSTSIDGVVELFTSQGCASCPAADEALTEMSSDQRLLTLSYHVDYWDYIGWKDPLGSPRNSERQRAYAKAIGLRSMFTPQVIVNGDRDVDAADRGVIFDVVGEAALPSRAAAVEVRLSKKNSTLHIEAKGPDEPAAGGQTVLILVTYRDSTTTAVERGENAGRSLVSSRSVRDWQVVGKLNGKAIDLDMPIATLTGTDPGVTGCAVLLQAMDEDGSPGPILAAAMLAL